MSHLISVPPGFPGHSKQVTLINFSQTSINIQKFSEEQIQDKTNRRTKENVYESHRASTTVSGNNTNVYKRLMLWQLWDFAVVLLDNPLGKVWGALKRTSCSGR
jgi:hypothetical protein